MEIETEAEFDLESEDFNLDQIIDSAVDWASIPSVPPELRLLLSTVMHEPKPPCFLLITRSPFHHAPSSTSIFPKT